METLVKSKLKYVTNKNFTLLVIFFITVGFIYICHQHVSLIASFFSNRNKNKKAFILKQFYSLFSAPSGYRSLFISGHTAKVWTLEVFIFLKSHENFTCQKCQLWRWHDSSYGPKGQPSECAAHTENEHQRLFSVKIKWIFICEDDGKRVRRNSLSRKNKKDLRLWRKTITSN